MTHNRISDVYLAVPPEVDGPWEHCPSAAAMRLWLRVWTHGQPVDRATLKTMTGQHRGPAIRTVRKAIDAGLLVPVEVNPVGVTPALEVNPVGVTRSEVNPVGVTPTPEVNPVGVTPDPAAEGSCNTRLLEESPLSSKLASTSTDTTVQLLTSLGVYEGVARRLVKKHSSETCTTYAKHLDDFGPVQCPGAFLATAIDEGYELPAKAKAAAAPVPVATRADVSGLHDGIKAELKEQPAHVQEAWNRNLLVSGINQPTYTYWYDWVQLHGETADE